MFTRRNILSATTQLLATVVAAAVLFAATSDAPAVEISVISVNFAGGNNNLPAGGGAGEAFVGAGPAGAVPVGNWNDAVGTGAAGGFSPLALFDDSGDPTGASVTWSIGNTWSSGGATGTPDQNLMSGLLDNFQGQSFTVSGLPAAFTSNGGYDVYVYFNVDQIAQMGFTADDGTVSDTRFGRQSGGAGTNYPLAGPNGYIVSTDSVNNFATATPSNVILLRGLSDSSFTLTGVSGAGAPGSGNRPRPNGFQIVALPEPTSFVLWSIFGAGLAACRWRRRNR